MSIYSERLLGIVLEAIAMSPVSQRLQISIDFLKPGYPPQKVRSLRGATRDTSSQAKGRNKRR